MAAPPLSANNPRIKRLRRLLTQRKARSREGVFVVEGPVQVIEALTNIDAQPPYGSRGVDHVLIDAEFDRSHAARIEALAGGHQVRIDPVHPGVLQRVLSTVTPQAVAAIVPQPQIGIELLPELAAPSPGPGGADEDKDPFLPGQSAKPTADRDAATPTSPLVIAVDVGDPGNLGTLIRTAEASGAAAVVATGTCADSFNPKVVRAAAGARLRLPVIAHPDPLDAIDAAKAAGWTIMAAAVRSDAVAYDRCALTGAAIVLGSEAHGLSPTILDHADVVTTIPLAGPTESLNVASAGAVLCFEALRQRRNNHQPLCPSPSSVATTR